MSIGYLPQAYKIIKTKSAEDVSVITYLILSIGTLVWTIYGIQIRDLPIIIGFSIGVFGSWLVLGATLYYNYKNGKKGIIQEKPKP
ncbi:MAG: hypothetical protein HYS87_00940 [Candidatus Colwellbacteria bacterium]|nr:hypothetical protein [Candidatus Colwellbacteria bacterium]